MEVPSTPFLCLCSDAGFGPQPTLLLVCAQLTLHTQGSSCIGKFFEVGLHGSCLGADNSQGALCVADQEIWLPFLCMSTTYTYQETSFLNAFDSDLSFCTSVGISYLNKLGASKNWN